MANWAKIKLGEVADFRNGLNYTDADLGRGLAVIGVADFQDRVTVDMDRIPQLSMSALSKADALVQQGDIVFVRSNGNRDLIGRSLFVKTKPTMPTSHSGFTIRCRFHDPRCKPRFYAYLFRGPIVRQTLSSQGGGTNISNLNQNILAQLEVPLPTKEDQERIALILSTYDNLIGNNTRRIVILEEMARRIFEEWFVHFRTPGCEGLPMVDSAIGPVPQGWEVKRLREVARVNPEQLSPKNTPATISYIDIASVSPGSIDAITQTSFAEAPNRARRIVRHGDIIWSCVRPNRRSFALVLHPSDDTIASTGFAVLRSIDIPWPYLYMMTTTQAFTDYLANHATGSAYPAVKPEDFENARLLVSPRALFTRFCTASEPMLLLAHSLRRQNANLRAQRDLLLPKLISGEIEIDPASASLKEAAE